ncbi:hypothetical protein HPB47_015575 [Ixodes persulcatus]|uniref:Uncharacterized protein n=1 Tax=Ixodes persulcatus TaxID=34615 RepID=A0AC60QT80_IXOPE|nr:hypothetical protein HPB47_015575 [Ixodes persulcatus]
MSPVSLKPGSVPSLRLAPFAMTTPAEEPASERPIIPSDEPTEDVGCSEGNSSREHCCSCGRESATREAMVQANPEEAPVAPFPPVREDKAVRRILGWKRTFLFTGASPAKTLRVLYLMNVKFFCNKTFYNYQRAVLLQAIAQAWAEEQGQLMDELRNQPLDLACDGRCGSRGFSAKYLTYSLYTAHANKILHLEQVQVESGQMENEGQITSLDFFKGKYLTVRSLTTDRHRSIAKHMRDQEAEILHYSDVMHVSKNTPAHARFLDVTTRKQLLHDLLQLSPDTQTYALESFHSVSKFFAAKAFAFSTGGMLARTRLAPLHFNKKSDRKQTTAQAGDPQWKYKSPKARKGHHDVAENQPHMVILE